MLPLWCFAVSGDELYPGLLQPDLKLAYSFVRPPQPPTVKFDLPLVLGDGGSQPHKLRSFDHHAAAIVSAVAWVWGELLTHTS